MSKLFVLIFNLLLLNESLAIKKLWKGSTSIKDSKNWKNSVTPFGKTNCSSQTIFPNNLYTAVHFDANIDTNEIILSNDGGLILGQDNTITFSETNIKTDKCEKEIIYQRPNPLQWYDVSNWEPIYQVGDQKYNKATPDTYWVPCQNDIVIFPNDSTIFIDVNFAPTLHFHEIEISNRKYNGDAFQEFLKTEIGSSMFLNAYATEINAGKCGGDKNCVCGDHQEFLCVDNVVCSEKGASCVDPILPNGFCCEICGGFIQFQINNEKTFEMETFLRSIEQTLSFSRYDKDSVEYFATFEKQNTIQLVMVDKVDGNDMSGEILNYLKQNLIEKMYKGSTKVLVQSGRSISPGIAGAFFYFIFFTLLIVVSVFGGFYFYNYRENINFIPAQLQAIISARQFPPSQFIFARFDNQQRGDGVIDIDVVTENSVNDDDEYVEKPSSFNNPLYEGELNLNEKDEKEVPKLESDDNNDTELKSVETNQNVQKIEVTKFDEVDLLGPNEE